MLIYPAVVCGKMQRLSKCMGFAMFEYKSSLRLIYGCHKYSGIVTQLNIQTNTAWLTNNANSISNKHKFQRAFWACGLNSLGPHKSWQAQRKIIRSLCLFLISVHQCVSLIFKGLSGPHISFSEGLP